MTADTLSGEACAMLYFRIFAATLSALWGNAGLAFRRVGVTFFAKRHAPGSCYFTAGIAFRYAAIASRSSAVIAAMFFCTSTMEPPTLSNSGVKPVSR